MFLLSLTCCCHRGEGGGDIAAVIVLVGACPKTELASVAWGGSNPRDMSLIICTTLINTICTLFVPVTACEMLSLFMSVI